MAGKNKVKKKRKVERLWVMGMQSKTRKETGQPDQTTVTALVMVKVRRPETVHNDEEDREQLSEPELVMLPEPIIIPGIPPQQLEEQAQYHAILQEKVTAMPPESLKGVTFQAEPIRWDHVDW